MAKIKVNKNMTLKQLENAEKKINKENTRMAKLNAVSKKLESLEKKR